MRVGATQRAMSGPAVAGAQRVAAGGARFEVGGSEGSDRADASPGNQRIVSIGTVLALQGVDNPLTGRRRAVARGNAVLDLLERLKVELLGGGISPDRLSGLKAAAEAARSDAESAEPGLKDALEAIDLRAQVELAKLTVPKAQA